MNWTLADFDRVRKRIIGLAVCDRLIPEPGTERVAVYLAPANGEPITARNRGERLEVDLPTEDFWKLFHKWPQYFDGRTSHRINLWNRFARAA